MCPGNFSRSEFIKGIREITLNRRVSTYDDDTDWLAQSPFDSKEYLFVSGMSSPMLFERRVDVICTDEKILITGISEKRDTCRIR